ncbi:hypothetical protein PCL_00827 [Purpureocillium lilacinum]|uniref:Zn(2)-C6 fungal-type domain-containing protein n=1 Tax=Purpureocillium lilacinum TaxID=33203 RepID=A0A2U3DP20_PURLI|nr:hypothetical protein PCL_00827 [Purpureocillium lilacinum]
MCPLTSKRRRERHAPSTPGSHGLPALQEKKSEGKQHLERASVLLLQQGSRLCIAARHASTLCLWVLCDADSDHLQCDGEDPCQRCKDAGLECAFDHSRRKSKDDLRAEIERLRRISERNEALLDALSSTDDADTYNTVAQRLMDSTVTRDSIYNDLRDHLKAVGQPEPTPAAVIAPSSRRHSPATSYAAATTSSIRPVTCPHCQGALPASSSVTDSNKSPGTTSERRLSGDAQSETKLLTIPASAAGCVPLVAVVLSLTGPEKTKQIDPWTRTGWPVSKIRDRFDSLLTWDYFPFCLLCKDPFLQDFASGDGRYCSPALVNSLLALSTRILDERQHPHQQQRQKEQQDCPAKSDAGGGFPDSDCWDGQALFDESETLISGKEHIGTLPDIQTLGMLALYQVSCGREAEARELAEAFKAEITKLCLLEPLEADKQDDRYMQVRATTYCGAISLVRYDVPAPLCLYFWCHWGANWDHFGQDTQTTDSTAHWDAHHDNAG